MLMYLGVKQFFKVRNTGKMSVQLVGLTGVVILGFFITWGLLHYVFNYHIPNSYAVIAIHPAPPLPRHIEHIQSAYIAAIGTSYLYWMLYYLFTTERWLGVWREYLETEKLAYLQD